MDLQPERASTSISLSAYLRLVRHNRNFRRLWLAQIVSEFGDWFYTLAIYSLLLQLTGRASSVALALVLQVLPQTFIGPAAGVINDRVSRKRVMIAADLARMVIVFAMLLVRSRSTVWLVYPLLLLETLMAAFFEPARTSVIPNITAREDVLVANTLSSATWSVNLLVGASVGGVVAALFGRDAVFVLNALSFLVSAMLIRGMSFEEPHAQAAAPLRLRDAIDLSPVLEGMRYVRKDRRLAGRSICQGRRAHDRSQLGALHGHGQRLFPCAGARHRSPTHRHAGHEPAAGRAGDWRRRGTALLRPLGGPIRSEASAGHSVWLSHDWRWIFRPGLSPNIWVACGFIVLAHCGGSTVWVFSTTHPAVEHRGPFPRPRLLRRPRFLHADHCDWRLRLRDLSRSRSVGASGGVSHRTHHAAAGAAVGLGDEVGPGNHVGTAALGCPAERSSAIVTADATDHTSAELRSAWTAEGGCPHVVYAGVGRSWPP